MWVKEFYGFEDYILEIEEYGIVLYVYCVWVLFDLVKIYVFLNGDLSGVICVKGYFWMVMWFDWVVEFLLVGVLLFVIFLGIWWVLVFEDCWFDY